MLGTGRFSLGIVISAHALRLACALVVSLLALSSCASELRSGAYLCEPNQAGDCPSDWLCQCRGAGCQWRCYESSGDYCGDGLLGPGEECDGVQFADESVCASGGYPFCRTDCTTACTECGNNLLEATPSGEREECDDGNQVDGDGCSPLCILSRCGDGFVDAELQEGCDDGDDNSNLPGARCRINCQPQRCGDGVVDLLTEGGRPAEVCDDGNLDPTDGCTPDCQSEVKCGNGYIDFAVGEQCDDANALSHDGCSSDCFSETLWTTVGPPAESYPSTRGGRGGRFWHATAYDASRGRLVLFGGRSDRSDVDTIDLGDTWEWDGLAWYQISGGGPGAMSGHDMTYHAGRKRVVLLGNGVWEWNGKRWARLPVAAGSPTPSRVSSIAYDARRDRLVGIGEKVWEWETSSRRWTDVTPATGVPSQDVSSQAVYDPSVGRIVLVGDGIWEWDGTTWTRVSTAQFAFAEGKSIVYDTRRGQVIWVLNGQEAWLWNSRTRTLTPGPSLSTPDNPSDQDGASLAHHGGNGRTHLIAGRHDGSIRELRVNSWPYVAEPTTYVPGGPYLKIFDERRGEHWLLGLGAESSNWISHGGSWRQLAPSPTRPQGGFAVYDGRRDRVIVLDSSPSARRTWEWNGTAWAQRPSGALPHLDYASMIYDHARGYALYVGWVFADSYGWNGSTWESAGYAENWVSLNAGMTFDRVRQRAVRFGGHRDGFATSHLFELSPSSSWVRITSGGPPPTEFATIWFDPDRKRTIFAPSGGQWEWDGATWADVTQGASSESRTLQSLTAVQQASALKQPVIASGPELTAGPEVSLRYQNVAAREETCRFGFDADGDGLLACADPDCWRSCTPLCSPGQPCPTDSPRCGDNVCNTDLEDCRLCPSDCGACPLVCGDFLCDPGETATSCPGDCR